MSSVSLSLCSQQKFARAKEEGNEFYRNGRYDEALGRYYQALGLCQQHKLEKEEAIIRGNCAQVCLQLELLKDAFDHADECLRLDPDSTKVRHVHVCTVLRIHVCTVHVHCTCTLYMYSVHVQCT